MALTFRSAADDLDRFPRSRDVGAWLGLTPRRWQSRKTDIAGRIPKAVDPRVRVMLFQAAASILGRARFMSPLMAWGLRIAKRTSMKKAIVAVSRKLATIPARDVEVRLRALGDDPTSGFGAGLRSRMTML